MYLIKYSLQTSDNQTEPIDDEILHLIRVGTDAANQKLFYWFNHAFEECPMEYFTHRCLKHSEIWQRAVPLFADLAI